MPKVDLVVVGNLLIDDLQGQPPLAGGAALHTALAARRCGLEVAVHSVVGEDYPLQILEEAGVHLSLTRLAGPGGRAVMRYTEHGRTLEHRGPGHETMTPQRPQPFQTRMLHLAPMPRRWQLFHLAQGTPGSALLDPYPRMTLSYWQELHPLQGQLRALLLNIEELDVEPQALSDDCLVVVKKGAKGGETLNPSCAWRAVETEVVDPTGAGDAFAGGFAAGLVQGLSLPAALNLGAEQAALVISRLGAG